MREAALTFEQLSPGVGDNHWHIELTATNGRFAGSCDFYEYPDSLSAFAAKLIAFPSAANDRPTLQADASEICAYVFSPLGRAAIGIVTCNGLQGAYLARAEFQIHAEIAAINRLGTELKRWISTPDRPMMWQPELERL